MKNPCDHLNTTTPYCPYCGFAISENIHVLTLQQMLRRQQNARKNRQAQYDNAKTEIDAGKGNHYTSARMSGGEKGVATADRHIAALEAAIRSLMMEQEAAE